MEKPICEIGLSERGMNMNQFKVGNWVFDKEMDEYLKVVEIHVDKVIFQGEDEDYPENYGDYEAVTAPWENLLLELGREKPEFNSKDIIVTNLEVFEVRWKSQDEIVSLFEMDLVTDFHPAEHRIEVLEYV